ncbi:MAG: Smr/MutS family protein [Litoreibacter sp.]
MARRGKRGLTDAEKELWSRVTDGAEALAPNRVSAPVMPQDYINKTVEVTEPIPVFRVGQNIKKARNTTQLAPSIAEHIDNAPLQMDRKAFTKMKRGKLQPEGRLDLHGMTLEQAHPRLNGFIMNAYSSGKRLVLVITGKGKSKQDIGPIPQRLGVLKHQVPMWLQQGALRPIVLQVTTANQKHGGSGAYYVFLRRAR